MTRVVLGLLFVCLFAGISHSEGGKCELKNGKSLAVDESYSDDDQCKKYNCKSDGLEEESCSRPDPDSFPDKGCKLVKKEGSFPNCCPQVSCPKGADMKQIRFIEERRKRSVPSEESAPLVVKRMPEQIVVKRHWQPGDIARGLGQGVGGAVAGVGKGIGDAIKSVSCFFFGCGNRNQRPPPVGPGGRPGYGNLNMGITILLIFRMIGGYGIGNIGELRNLEIMGTDKVGRIGIEQFPSLHDINLGDLKGMSLGQLGGFSPTGLEGTSIDSLRGMGLNVDGLRDVKNLSVKGLLIIYFKILGNLLSSGANLGDLNRLRLGGRDLNSVNWEGLNFGKLGELTARDLHRLSFGLKGDMEGWGDLSQLNFVSLILLFFNGYKNAYPNAQIPQISVAWRPRFWLRPDGIDLSKIDLSGKNLGNVIIYILHLLGNLKGRNIGDFGNLRILGNGGTNIRLQEIGNIKGLDLGVLRNLNLDGIKGVHSGDLNNLGAVADFNDLSFGKLLILFLKGLVKLANLGNLGDLSNIKIWNDPLSKVNLDNLDLGDLGKAKMSDLNGMDFGSMDMSIFGNLAQLDLGSLLLLYLKRVQNENIPDVKIGGKVVGGKVDVKVIETPGDLKYITDPKELEKLKEQGYEILGHFGNVDKIDPNKLKEYNIHPDELKKIQNKVSGGKIEVSGGSNSGNFQNVKIGGGGGGGSVNYQIVSSGNAGNINLEGFQGGSVGGAGGGGNVNYKVINYSGDGGDIDINSLISGAGGGSNVKVISSGDLSGINLDDLKSKFNIQSFGDFNLDDLKSKNIQIKTVQI